MTIILQPRHPHQVITEDYKLHFLLLQTVEFPTYQGPWSQAHHFLAVPVFRYIHLHLLVTVSHQPWGQLNSYLMSQNAEGRRAYRALVPTVSQQMDGKMSCFIFFVGHLLRSE